jgi:hypothetical protein
MADGMFVKELFSPLSATTSLLRPKPEEEPPRCKDPKWLSLGSSIKIASAVVLVERSEIACIEGKKKIKASNTIGDAGAVFKKDVKKDKDRVKIRNRDEVEDEVDVRDKVAGEKLVIVKAASEDSDTQRQLEDQQQGKKMMVKSQDDLDIGLNAKKRCADRYDSSESSDR